MSEPRLRHEAALTAASALGATALAGLASIAIARGLGVEARGAWAVVASSATLAATVAALGLPEGAAYGVARSSKEHRPALVAGCAAAAVLLGGAAALATAVALVLQDGTDHGGLVAAGALVAVAAVLAPVGERLVQVALGPRPYAVLRLATPAAVLVVILVLVASESLTAARVAVVSGLAAAGAAAAGVALVARAGQLDVGAWRHPLRSLRPLRPLVGYSLLTFATLALTHAVQRLDVLLVNGYRGARDAGLYAVAVQFGELLLVVPAALAVVAFRRGVTGPDGAWDDFVRLARWAAVAGVLAAAALVATAGWLVPAVVGAAYDDAVDAARILAPGVAILGVQSVLSNYVAARGRPRSVLAAWGLGAAATLVGDLWAIPRHGIEGAAAVSSAGYALVLALHVLAVRRVRDADRASA